ILVGKLEPARQASARRIGLALAMVGRIGLLFSLSWVVRLTRPLFTVLEAEISGRDLVLIVGGLFLVAKSTHEIYGKLEGQSGHASTRVGPTYASVLVQIMLLDLVFSLDSVITAVGMVDRITVMVAAVVTAVGFMMLLASRVSEFIHRHPSVKMLALAFLLMIGVMLVAEGFGPHIPQGYVYFAMAFSVFLQAPNIP